jgi:hypothetical protein
MVNAFSFCIYGREQPKYHTGLLENIQLVSTHFPGWKVFVYVGSETPAAYIRTLQAAPNVVVRLTGISGHRNSLHRFFAIDEPEVDLMMVRDADSRIHWKDRWAIQRFLDSGKAAHIIRDHQDHSTPILAGLWGLRKEILDRPLREMVAEWSPVHAGSGTVDDPMGFGIDQNFLKLVLYPMITNQSLVTYSFNCLYPGECAELFPFEWTDELYCGQRVELSGAIAIEQFIPRQPVTRALDFLPKR